MQKMPTRTAEKVYDVLCKFAEASPNYYEKETFVFHFGVLSTTQSKYKLNCMDDAQRSFICTDEGRMWVDGSNAGKVNSILRKISEEMVSQRIEDEVPSSN